MQGAKFKVWITTQEYIIMTCLWILSLGTIDSTNYVWCSLKFGDNCDGFDLYIYSVLIMKNFTLCSFIELKMKNVCCHNNNYHSNVGSVFPFSYFTLICVL